MLACKNVAGDWDLALRRIEDLLKKGAEVNHGDENGFTAACYAIRTGVDGQALKVLKMLRPHIQDVNKSLCKGTTTLLELAIKSEAYHCFCYLIKEGASLQVKSSHGTLLISYLKKRERMYPRMLGFVEGLESSV